MGCGIVAALMASFLLNSLSARGQTATTQSQTATTLPAPASKPTSAEAPKEPETPIGPLGTPEQKLLPTVNEPGMGKVLWQMFSSVLVILGLGAAAILIIKKVLPRLGLAAGGRGLVIGRGGSLRVLETVRLGQQRSVHLLEAEGRKFLLGDAREGITLLAEIKPQAQTSQDKPEGNK
jgi:flagellar biogenesis protein FliO